MRRHDRRRQKNLLIELGNRLDEQARHFLPTFWEEAARIFLRADNPTFAAQMFTRAREVERTHALPIDETRHAAAFEEFISAGAVTAKVLSAESQRLFEQLEPEAALEGFLNLVRAQFATGAAPYAVLPKDVRRLAEAAGKDLFEVEAPIVREVVNSPSFSVVPKSAWKAWAPTVEKLVANDGAVADAMVASVPTFGVEDFSRKEFARWVDYMNKVGLTTRLAEHTPTPAATRWIRKAVGFFDTIYTTDDKDLNGLRKLVSQMTQLDGQVFTINEFIDARLLEALVAVGMIPEFSEHRRFQRCIRFYDWDKISKKDDFPALAAYSSQNPSLFDHLRIPKEPERCLATQASTELLEGVVHSLLNAPHSTYSDFADVAEQLECLMESDALNQHFAEEFGQLRRKADGPEILAASLRQGLLTEYDWPVMQQAIDELVAAHPFSKPLPPLVFHPSWPWIGVSLGSRGHVIFLRGDERGPEATFSTRYQSYWSPGDGPSFLLVDGVIACDFENGDKVMAWSNDPRNILNGESAWEHDDRAWTFETSDGRLAQGNVVRVGEPNNSWAGNYLTEGTHFWRAAYGRYLQSGREPVAVREVDPETGAEGEKALPQPIADMIEPYVEQGFELDAQNMYWLPDDNFPAASTLVSRGGMRGWVPVSKHKDSSRTTSQNTYLLPDGTAVTGPQNGKGAVERAGGGITYLFEDSDSFHDFQDYLYGRDEQMRALPPAANRKGDYHWIHWLPVPAFAHLSMRDEAVSQRLRTITADDVKDLYWEVYPVADPLRENDEKKRNKRYRASEKLFSPEIIAVAEKLLGTSDSAIVDSVIHLAAHVKHYRNLLGKDDQDEKQDKVFEPAAPVTAAPAEPVQAPQGDADDYVLRWYEVLGNPKRNNPDEDLKTADSVRRLVSGVRLSDIRFGISDVFDWAVTHPELLITLAVTPGRPVEDAEASLNLAEIILDSGAYSDKMVSFTYEADGPVAYLDEGVISLPGGGRAVVWPHWDMTNLGVSFTGELPPEKSGFTLREKTRSLGLSPEVLRQALTAARQKVTTAKDQGEIPATDTDRERARQLAEKTGWDLTTAQLLLAGLPGEWNYRKGMTKALAAKGFKKDVVDIARSRFFATGADTIAEMLVAASANPVEAVTTGLDVDAAASVVEKTGNGFNFSDMDLHAADFDTERFPSDVPLLVLQRRLHGEDIDNFWQLESLLAIHVHWAQNLPFDSPAREWLAGEMESLHDTAMSMKTEFSSIDDVTMMLGLGPTEKWDGNTYDDGPWSLTLDDQWHVDVVWDPSKVED